MIVRKFKPEDLKRVFEIENMSFDQSYGVDVFQGLYEMGVGFLVAEDEGYVVGYVIFWIKYENQGHIISIAVDKNYRRSHVGSQLLIKAISILSMLSVSDNSVNFSASRIALFRAAVLLKSSSFRFSASSSNSSN